MRVALQACRNWFDLRIHARLTDVQRHRRKVLLGGLNYSSPDSEAWGRVAIEPNLRAVATPRYAFDQRSPSQSTGTHSLPPILGS